MPKYKDFFRRAQDEDERCQTPDCPNAQMPGSEHCPAHGGNKGYTKMMRQKRRLYDLKRYSKKVDDLRNHEQASTFREEIAILRMMLETRLKQCEDDHELMLHSQSISQLVMNIEKAVTSAAKLERELGKVLTEEQASAFIAEITEIVGNYTDVETKEAICNEILQSLDSKIGPESE